MGGVGWGGGRGGTKTQATRHGSVSIYHNYVGL